MYLFHTNDYTTLSLCFR